MVREGYRAVESSGEKGTFAAHTIGRSWLLLGSMVV
jgi:hypothetical protein